MSIEKLTKQHLYELEKGLTSSRVIPLYVIIFYVPCRVYNKKNLKWISLLLAVGTYEEPTQTTNHHAHSMIHILFIYLFVQCMYFLIRLDEFYSLILTDLHFCLYVDIVVSVIWTLVGQQQWFVGILYGYIVRERYTRVNI